MPCCESGGVFLCSDMLQLQHPKISRKVLTRFMLVSKIRRSAFGVRRSAFGVRRSAFGNACALIRNNSSPRNIYALADNLHVSADMSAGLFLRPTSCSEAVS